MPGVLGQLTESDHGRLRDFIVGTFTEPDLRSFVEGFDELAELAGQLPSPGAGLHEVANVFVHALERRGLVDQRLFSALRRRSSSSLEALWEISHLFGVDARLPEVEPELSTVLARTPAAWPRSICGEYRGWVSRGRDDKSPFARDTPIVCAVTQNSAGEVFFSMTGFRIEDGVTLISTSTTDPMRIDVSARSLSGTYHVRYFAGSNRVGSGQVSLEDRSDGFLIGSYSASRAAGGSGAQRYGSISLRRNNTPTRIVLTGAPYSGKSTLIEELARRGHAVEREAALGTIAKLEAMLGSEVIRRWRASPTGRAEFQTLLAFLQAEQAERTSMWGRVFLDRGLHDGLAFCHARGTPSPELLRMLCDSTQYQLVVFCSRLPNFDPRTSEGRMSTPEIAAQIEELLEAEYSRRNMPIVRLGVEGSLEERVERLLLAVDKQLGAELAFRE
jgi:predicted ATPase